MSDMEVANAKWLFDANLVPGHSREEERTGTANDIANEIVLDVMYAWLIRRLGISLAVDNLPHSSLPQGSSTR